MLITVSIDRHDWHMVESDVSVLQVSLNLSGHCIFGALVTGNVNDNLLGAGTERQFRCEINGGDCVTWSSFWAKVDLSDDFRNIGLFV